MHFPLNRRSMLARSAGGFGSMALYGLLAGCEQSREAQATRSTPSRTPSAKAKSVIFLYMEGGPSQMDTFDPKPRLDVEDGQPLRLSSIPNRMTRERILRSPFRFGRFGECGMDVSDLFPHVAQCVDSITLIRSMVSEHADHGSANYFMNTGSGLRGRPAMGAWFAYGLGSENGNLPAYVVLNDGQQLVGGEGILSSGFLPAKFGPTLLRSSEQPLPNLNPSEQDERLQKQKIDTVRMLNEQAVIRQGMDSPLEAVIANYELAFRMQSSVLESVDDTNESEATKKLYGLDDPVTEVFGRSCLRARRLVERGVRFIQLVSPPCEEQPRWDQHSELRDGHRLNAVRVDKPIAGLLKDLEGRGLLDQTLVVWGGEFGRTPTSQYISSMQKVGRDHNPYGFSMWLAGAGIKRGYIHGATDEYGFRAIENPVTVHDLHATILHLFGIDHTELTYRHGGRDYRLTDVYGEVVTDLLA